MAVDSSWDVNNYKYEHELEHHWELKKAFIVAHKDKFPEDHLICLAQTFYNIEVLGCRYDANVMNKVRSLADAVAPVTSKITKEKEKYSKGFIAASNAVVERVKAKLGLPIVVENSGRDDAKTPGDWAAAAASRKRPRDRSDSYANKRQAINFNDPSSRQNEQNQSSFQSGGRSSSTKGRAPWLDRINVGTVVKSGPFGRVVVFEGVHGLDTPATIIERTASASQMTTSFNFIQTTNTDSVGCQFSLNGLFLAVGSGATQKLAKEAACKQGIERLKQTCFTVQVKAAFVGDGSEVGRTLERSSTGPVQTMENPLPADNLGSKMLKLMGWAGGGLGKEGQGLEEPIAVDATRISREGLGASGSMQEFRKKARQLLEDFATSESSSDLVFSPDLTKEERKILHEMVRRYNLKSRSYGKGDLSRHLVISRRVSPIEIVEELIHEGGQTDKYTLIPPESFLS